MRIIVADHHPESLWALTTWLAEEPGIRIAGEASESETLLKLATAHPVDLVLMDGELPGLAIDSLIKQLHDLAPKPNVIVMGSNPEFSKKYLKAGADAIVSKGDQPDWLFETLQHWSSHPESEIDQIESST
jgi:DNA-binding NarL/FixJ family response regulator